MTKQLNIIQTDVAVDSLTNHYNFRPAYKNFKMARYVMIKLPASYNFEDIRHFEFKATSKSGDEMINQDEFDYVTVSNVSEKQSSLVSGHGNIEEEIITCTAVYRVPCIELSTLL